MSTKLNKIYRLIELNENTSLMYKSELNVNNVWISSGLGIIGCGVAQRMSRCRASHVAVLRLMLRCRESHVAVSRIARRGVAHCTEFYPVVQIKYK